MLLPMVAQRPPRPRPGAGLSRGCTRTVTLYALAIALLLCPTFITVNVLWRQNARLSRLASLEAQLAALGAAPQPAACPGASPPEVPGSGGGTQAEPEGLEETPPVAASEEAEEPSTHNAAPLRPPTLLYDLIAASQNPESCNASNLVRCSIMEHNFGFGFQLHQLASCIIEAFYQGKTAVLWPPTMLSYAPECESSWSCYFEPISSCHSLSNIANIMSSAQKPASKVPDNWVPEGVPATFLNPGAYVIGVVLQYIMRPVPRLQALLDAKAKHVDYGIHIRRTDKLHIEAWYHDLEQYMQALDRVTNPSWHFHSAYRRVYNRTVFIATDDSSVWEELSGYPQYHVYHGNGASHPRHTQAGLDEFLVELFTLMDSNYFVGTFSSQVSRIVFEIFHTRFLDAYDRAWSLDDPWYGIKYGMVFPSMTQYMEREGGLGLSNKNKPGRLTAADKENNPDALRQQQVIEGTASST
ncbi:alpha 1,6 fucosyltransferase [Pelomyxa schiedti]|nr:alpha 1,6 fucosyltransferase [Pelomyxa schiedti]